MDYSLLLGIEKIHKRETKTNETEIERIAVEIDEVNVQQEINPRESRIPRKESF